MCALLILIRHPPVDLPSGICYGRKDVGLAGGFDMTEIIDKIPKQPDLEIWSSPSRRCASVAIAVAEHLSAHVRYDDRLRELDFGGWEGMAWSDVPRTALDAWAADPLGFAPPSGESGAQLVSRVQKFYLEMCALRFAHIVISHGGPLRILLALAQGAEVRLLAPSPPLGSVQIICPPAQGGRRLFVRKALRGPSTNPRR